MSETLSSASKSNQTSISWDSLSEVPFSDTARLTDDTPISESTTGKLPARETRIEISATEASSIPEQPLVKHESISSHLAIHLPGALRDNLIHNRLVIDYNILGEPHPDPTEEPVVADFDPDLAKRLRRLSESSDVDFTYLAVHAINSAFDPDDPERRPPNYLNLSDESLTKVAAIAGALEADFDGLPERCHTDADVGHYYQDFRNLCEAFRDLDSPLTPPENDTQSSEQVDHQLLVAGATIFTQTFLQDYDPKIHYDIPAITNIVKEQFSDDNIIGSNLQYLNQDFRQTDIRQLACTTLMKGYSPAIVDQYLTIRKSANHTIEDIDVNNNLSMLVSFLTQSVMHDQLEAADARFAHTEPSPNHLTQLSDQCLQLANLCTIDERTLQPLSQDYNLLLQHYQPKLAERLQRISTASSINISQAALALADSAQRAEEALGHQTIDDFSAFSDDTLAKFAELFDTLQFHHSIENLHLTPDRINTLYENSKALQAELSQIPEFGPNTIKYLVQHFTNESTQKITENVSNLKQLLDVAKLSQPYRGEPDLYLDFIRHAVTTGERLNYTLPDMSSYYRVSHHVQNHNTTLAANLLQYNFQNASLKPTELTAYQENIAPLLDTIDNFTSAEAKNFSNSYFRAFNLTTDSTIGFRDNILPRLLQDDPEVTSLSRYLNFIGYRGESRIARYEQSCFTTRLDPTNLNLLLQDQRNLPTSDLHKLEQNRIDALAIENVVIGDHGFIHDEDPLTHQLLTAMVDYYDSQDTPHFSQADTALQRAVAACQTSTGSVRYTNLSNYVFDLQNYDRRIDGQVNDDNHIEEYHESAIDIVRRLAANTDPTPLKPPHTSDETLNQLLTNAEIYLSPADHSPQADWRETSVLTAYLNQQLIAHQGELSLSPSLIQAISYTERAATIAMRGIDQKDWRELPFDPGFKQFVMFRELTASGHSFNLHEFEDFWDGFSSLPIDANDATIRSHYERLQRHTFTQINALAKTYNQTNRSQYVGAIWSGNLTHEIINLTEPPHPRTLRERLDSSIAP